MEESQPTSHDPDAPEIVGAVPQSTGDLEDHTPEKPVPPPRPWGPWATIGWTLLCIVVLFVAASRRGDHRHGRARTFADAPGSTADDARNQR